MKSFISNVVEDVLNKNKNYNNLICVLPSQRACVFLKEELINSIPKTSFLPKIISIENYIQELADISLIDNTQLLFEFYSIYKQKIKEENIDSFDSFSQWATIALQDFNEIDSYLIDTEVFFSNLKDIKKLNNWFQNKKPTKLAIDYLQFFEYLDELYTELYKKLKDNKVGYQGLIYREAKDNLEFYINSHSKEHTVFIGFNALNNAEELIIQELLLANMASIYWDANEAMLKSINGAGVFLRKYKNEWSYYKNNPFLWIEDFTAFEKNIHIISVPKNITQIKYVGELLSNFTDFSKTAFVLADESLLTLALNSLPNNVKNINITMGYPLKDIPIASLFEKFFKLHLNQEKFNKVSEGEFYYKDVLNLLNDPFLNKFESDLLQKTIRKIKSENSIFLSVASLQKNLSEIEKTNIIFSLFYISSNINNVINSCIEFINQLKDVVTGIEKEYLYRFYNTFKQLQSLNTEYNHIDNLKTLYLFFNQLLSNEKLSFQGEPLQGLQLMGMLETRALDFDTVIITSVNEGVLPGGKSENSFLPFDIKKHFNLPTYQEKDAIFSYHFQRLLQRAKNVYLVYNTETDGYGAGEKSRFITQLEIENPNLIKTAVSPKVQQLELPENTIKKTPEVLTKLKEVFEKGISPSALATYIYNPMSFYEQKVLDISEDSEVEETIEANTMGSVIHDVLEELYFPFLNKFLKEENIVEMRGKIDELLNKYFDKHYVKGNILTGKNKLIFEVSRTYIHKFLKQELQLLKQNKQLKILALEEKLETEIIIDGIDFPIKLKGIVDRVDELDGITRIIDYKTGKVEASQLKIPDFSVISTDYKYTKALQVMMYSLMYSKEKSTQIINPIEAGIISFKSLNSGFLKMNFSDKRGVSESLISLEKIEEFSVELNTIIKEILNPEIPFIPNKDLPF